MTSIISSVTFYALSSLIGKEMITRVIKETANNACGVMYNFIDHPEINIVLKELDTKAVLKKTENIIKNINLNDINETIHIILNQLHQIICEIVDDLSKINHSLKEYQKKWFRMVRKADYKPYLEKLKLDHKILDKRFSSQWGAYNYVAVMDGNLVSFMNKFEHEIGSMKRVKAKVKSQTQNKLFSANETRLNYVKLYKV